MLADCFRTPEFDDKSFCCVTAQAEDRRLTLRQEASYFPLVVTAGQAARRWRGGGFCRRGREMKIDPDGELLLRR